MSKVCERLCLQVGLAAVVGVALIGCAPMSRRGQLVAPPRFGYVEEVDEPAARGQLVRVSPEDLDVTGRFALSPDGKWLVFSARPGDAHFNETYNLYRIPAVGGGAPVKLTAGGDASAVFPSFSPDSKYIYYSTVSPTGTVFWRMNADGSGARTKIPGSGLGGDCCNQTSSEDRVVFTSCDFTLRRSRQALLTSKQCLIWTVRPDGGELTQFREGEFPSWSPDGRMLVFDFKDDLWTLGSDGRTLTQLTNTPDVVEGVACFSPDGQSVAFTSNEDKDGKAGSDFNVWTVRTDGSQKQQLTELRSWDSWPLWGGDGVYFLSGRGSRDKKVTRIWKWMGL
jgi:Tol biopolymer transport system component